MLELGAELGRIAAAALAAVVGQDQVPAELPVGPAARPQFGDLQIAACLQLARSVRRAPRELAQIVQAALAGHPALERVEVAGPGYVNLVVRTAWLEQQVTALLADARLGVRPHHEGQTVVLDFSSPNIAKPMHIGHIRSTIIGDSLQRVLRAVGYRVISDNHLGDWGTQFGKLIVAYRRWLDRAAYEQDPIGELVRLYQRFTAEERREAEALGLDPGQRRAGTEMGQAPDQDEEAEEETGPRPTTPLLAEARAELARLQRGDADNLALWREFVQVSMAVFARTYQRLGVRFDVQLGESFYHERLGPLVEELLQRGIAQVSQGAVICPVEGAPAPLLVRKGDGSFLYGTTDLATIEYRVRTWAPDRILYVVGAPQQLHFRLVFAVARRMGVTCSLEHISFGSLLARDESGRVGMFRTRQGGVLLLDHVLDEAVRRAAEVARRKNPDLSDAEVAEVARVVGIGAVKYNDLCRDRDTDVIFDLDRALALEGNTAPYIQYAYARIRSIARKAGADPSGPVRLEHPAERQLAWRLLGFPAVVEQVARTARPHHLAEYLYGLSGALSTFYNEVPVLRAAPAERASRLALLEVVARTLRRGLELLGIEVLERM
ncbi:MAG: arginine--tRNA ligase [Myxococcales bacterium]|nr:arginine--tRNA ligase [Myxococcota bacterium]MDW8280797.1 arginine--tRNA ligase [Myxococcales bacterium]